MTRDPHSASNPGAYPAPPVTRKRRQALALSLPMHMDMLWRRRAAEVPAGDLDAYIVLGWMRWAAGRIIITPEGVAMRDIVIASGEEGHEHR